MRQLSLKSDVITLDQILERLSVFRSTAAGETITAETALRAPTVYAIVNLARRTVGQLPVDVVKVRGGKRKPQPEHQAAMLLNKRPNVFQTPFAFKSAIPTQLLLHGNFYAQKAMGGGRVVNLNPLPPASMSVKQGLDMRLTYTATQPAVREFSQEQIIHVRDVCTDDIVGLSPISQVKEAIGVEIAAEKFGAGFFGGGAFPSGIIEHPSKFGSTEAFDRFKTTWQAAFGKMFKRGGERQTAILEGGMKFTPLQLNNEESQFLETRKLQREIICGAFGIPPHMVGALERSTFNNIEHQSLEFVIYWLTPMLVNIEQTLEAALLSDAERDNHQIKFNVEALLRGDRQSRQTALHTMRNDGIINANEWRALEDMDPIEGEAGEAYLIQGAMITVDKAIEGPPAPVAGNQAEKPQNSAENTDETPPADGDSTEKTPSETPAKSEKPALRVA